MDCLLFVGLCVMLPAVAVFICIRFGPVLPPELIEDYEKRARRE